MPGLCCRAVSTNRSSCRSEKVLHQRSVARNSVSDRRSVSGRNSVSDSPSKVAGKANGNSGSAGGLTRQPLNTQHPRTIAGMKRNAARNTGAEGRPTLIVIHCPFETALSAWALIHPGQEDEEACLPHPGRDAATTRGILAQHRP